MLAKFLPENINRFLYLCLIGSCLGHLLFLTILHFIVLPPSKHRARPMEIVYHSFPSSKEKSAPPKSQNLERLEKREKDAALAKQREVVDKKLMDKALMKDMAKPDKVGIPDKELLRGTNFVEKRSVSVPFLASQKITNPKYISYYDRLRDKIRNRAYFYIDDPKFEAGEVYVSFLVTSEGALKEIKVLEEKSRGNEYLKNAAVRSIQEASPFPPFPPDLQYPELPFNVAITFNSNKESN